MASPVLPSSTANLTPLVNDGSSELMEGGDLKDQTMSDAVVETEKESVSMGEGKESTQVSNIENRIIVDGLPKFWNQKGFLAFLKKQNISENYYLKVKKIPNQTIAIVTFRNGQSKDPFCDILDGTVCKKDKIRIDRSPQPVTQHHKRK
jgi:hypothetical protein